MKFCISLVLAVCTTLCVCAENAVYQDINYRIDTKNRTAEVTQNPKASGELYIPAEIPVGQQTYRVTGIGENAFKGCKNLTAIVLPRSIERIYRSAFDGTGIMLDKKNWTDGVLMIDSCLIATDKSIKPKYAVPEGTRVIAAGAFRGNKTITRVDFPASVSRIDHDTFRDCKNLVSLSIPQTITEIGEDAFTHSGIWNNDKKWRRGALYINGCLIAVNDQAPAEFVFKTKMPTRLIANRAFAESKNIRSVTLPDGITTIPAAAFYGCENLTRVVIPASVKRVDNFAFYGCVLLQEATLPSGLESLGAGAFYGCEQLKAQVLPDNLTVIPQGCFTLCRSIRKITLPSRLTRIGDGAFAGCALLEDMKLPETLREIGDVHPRWGQQSQQGDFRGLYAIAKGGTA